MITGYDELINNFKNLISSDTLSHAYLFFGGDKKTHEEKFVFSLSLANFLEKGIFEEPKDILKETMIISPDEKGVIGIDKIRILRYYLWQKPADSKRRIAIINGAENLTDEAQNAALKIVEEPPESGLIILISRTAEDLLPTLASRTQKIYFSSKTQVNSAKKGYKYEYNTAHINERESVLTDAEIDKIFEDLILNLKRDKIKNSRKLKETLSRLTLMKQFNTNKKLQLRALDQH